MNNEIFILQCIIRWIEINLGCVYEIGGNLIANYHINIFNKHFPKIHLIQCKQHMTEMAKKRTYIMQTVSWN